MTKQNSYWIELCEKADCVYKEPSRTQDNEGNVTEWYITYPPETAEKILGLMKVFFIGDLSGLDLLGRYCVLFHEEEGEIFEGRGKTLEEALCKLITQPEVWNRLDIEKVKEVLNGRD